ncbi:MAG TPA: MliC family protein [Gemmatimonadales bacterium]|nr:MliC family protein [Gemmatimonadales bacterium]
MLTRILPPMLLLAAFAACAASGDEEARPASIDSAIQAFKAESAPPLPTAPPEVQPLVVGNDTIVARGRYLCLPDVAVSAVYWRGEHPRVILNVADTQVLLPQVVAASGARYGIASPPTEWWNKGDSATFSFDGQRLACGPSDTLKF